MKIHELDKLADIDQYHAAQAMIDDLIDRTDKISERQLDQLFTLVSEYEMDDWGSEPCDLDFDYHKDYDRLEWY